MLSASTDRLGRYYCWVALTPSNARNGAMKFMPGSHKAQAVPHNDTYAEDNLLSRGQEARLSESDFELCRLDAIARNRIFYKGADNPL